MKYELLPNLHNISGQRDLCVYVCMHTPSKSLGLKRTGPNEVGLQFN